MRLVLLFVAGMFVSCRTEKKEPGPFRKPVRFQLTQIVLLAFPATGNPDLHVEISLGNQGTFPLKRSETVPKAEPGKRHFLDMSLLLDLKKPMWMRLWKELPGGSRESADHIPDLGAAIFARHQPAGPDAVRLELQGSKGFRVRLDGVWKYDR